MVDSLWNLPTTNTSIDYMNNSATTSLEKVIQKYKMGCYKNGTKKKHDKVEFYFLSSNHKIWRLKGLLQSFQTKVFCGFHIKSKNSCLKMKFGKCMSSCVILTVYLSDHYMAFKKVIILKLNCKKNLEPLNMNFIVSILLTSHNIILKPSWRNKVCHQICTWSYSIFPD